MAGTAPRSWARGGCPLSLGTWDRGLALGGSRGLSFLGSGVGVRFVRAVRRVRARLLSSSLPLLRACAARCVLVDGL